MTSRLLPTSRLGYHAGKPVENVVYCLNKRETCTPKVLAFSNMFKAEKTVNDIFYVQIPINANTLPPTIDEVKLSEVQLLRVRVTFHILPLFHLRT